MSNYKEHFEKELQFARNQNKTNSFIEDCIPEIQSIISKAEKQGWSGGSAPYFINSLKNAIDCALNFKLMTPLTGEDDEWNEIRENDYQNSRLSSVFKNSNNIYDIDADVYRTKNILDINTGIFTKGYGLWNSSQTIFYNTKTDEWAVLKMGIIKDIKSYMGTHQSNIIDTIEVKDSNDKNNDYICRIANINWIPKEYFIDYTYEIDKSEWALEYMKECKHILDRKDIKELVM